MSDLLGVSSDKFLRDLRRDCGHPTTENARKSFTETDLIVDRHGRMPMEPTVFRSLPSLLGIPLYPFRPSATAVLPIWEVINEQTESLQTVLFCRVHGGYELCAEHQFR